MKELGKMSNLAGNKNNMQEKNQKDNAVCYIVGAGDLNESGFAFINRGLLIAADGGYNALKKLKILPDYLIGDFDSLEEITEEVHTEVYNKEKDETDMVLAVNKGLDLGYNVFVIYGGLGGRLEHSIANIQLLTYIAKKNSKGYLIQGESIITVLSDEEYRIKAQKNGYLSVFSLSEVAKGVTLKGLKYLLNDSDLKHDYPMGVSNEFIGEDVVVEVKNGILMVMWRAKKPEESLFL